MESSDQIHDLTPYSEWDEIQAADSDNLQYMRQEGWTMLAILNEPPWNHGNMDTARNWNRYLMGRKTEQQDLAWRMVDLQREFDELTQELNTLKGAYQKLEETHEQMKRIGTEKFEAFGKLQESYRKIEKDLGKVRNEIGDAEWRRICGRG